MPYDTLIIEPLLVMLHKVVSFIPTLFLGLSILIVGYVVAHAVRKLFDSLFEAIEFDKMSSKIGLTNLLKNGGVQEKPSHLVGYLLYWVLMVMFLIVSVKTFGLTVVSHLLDVMLAFIPSVIAGILVLTIGMLIAKFVSSLVYVVAKATDMPLPETIARLSKYAIMIFVSIMFLKEIGFTAIFVGTHYTIFIGGIVFATALAFGLAGKDIAHRYLEVLNVKKPKDH